MDLTVDLPDSRGNFRFVWPLHDPDALINTRPPIYTRHLWKIALFLTWRQNADHFSKLVYGTQKSITKGSTITIHAQVFGHCPNSFCTPLPALKWALWGTSSRKKVPQTIRARVQTPQNQANSSQKNCSKPSWQALRPPTPTTPLRTMPK